jgi:uncharacterized membrane protein SpoIIM required for sporulation
MTVRAFAEERKGAWDELTALVERAGRRPERLGSPGVRRLGSLYRAAAADLAVARRLYPGEPVVTDLETIVGRARSLVYGTRTRTASLREFALTGYWRLAASHVVPIVISAACLFAPALLAGTWALRDPGSAAGLVPQAYRSVTEPRPRNGDLGLTPAENTALASEIFTNNIRVTFLAFAAGILLALGTVLVVVYNGVLLGAVGGLAIGAGNGRPFVELVTAHGVLELSCIVVAGGAGMRMGWALVEPGRATRREALAAQARRSVQIVLGTMPWLVVAGLVEGFLTPAGLGLPAVIAIGFSLGAVYWTLVVARGVRTRREPSSARMP